MCGEVDIKNVHLYRPLQNHLTRKRGIPFEGCLFFFYYQCLCTTTYIYLCENAVIKWFECHYLTLAKPHSE